MADRNHKFAVKMLHYYGFLTRSDPTIKNIAFGRADIACMKGGKAVNVEVKCGDMRFDLRDWRENQREWALRTQDFPYEVQYYIFLTMGIDKPNYLPKKYFPKKSWLIPSRNMFDVISKISPIQHSLIYRIKKGTNKEFQKLGYDAVTLLRDYELTWAKNNSLIMPQWVRDEIKDMTENDDDIENNDSIYEKSIDEQNNDSNTYGGFWIVPDNHVFAIEGWTDTVNSIK